MAGGHGTGIDEGDVIPLPDHGSMEVSKYDNFSGRQLARHQLEEDLHLWRIIWLPNVVGLDSMRLMSMLESNNSPVQLNDFLIR